MRLLTLTILTLFSISGCAFLNDIEASAQAAVSLYCDAPQKLRLANRALVDNVVSPNKIAITCAGDL